MRNINILYTFLIIALTDVFPFIAEAAINPEAIVLSLSFDEGDGEEAKDVSPLGNDVFFVEGPKWDEGKFGKCVRLKKTAHLETEMPNLDLHNTDLTMAMWVNFAADPGWVALMSHDEGAQIGAKKWAWWYSAGAFVFYIDDADEKREWVRSDFFGIPELNRWYHVAFVKQKDIHTHYVDGEPFGEEEKKAPVPEAIIGPLSIGATGIRYFFQGLLDEALIVKQALSQNDIQKHLDGGVAGILAVEPSGKLATRWGSLKVERDLSGNR